jgi:hypothetical protein
MTVLLHISTCSNVLAIARSSSRYPGVVWLWDLPSWSFEFHVWTYSYDPSSQSRILGRAGSCREWNLENGWNFVQLKPLPCMGGNKAHCGGAASNCFFQSSDLFCQNGIHQMLQFFATQHNSLFVLEGQNNAAPCWMAAKGISLVFCLDLLICDFLLWGYILVCDIEDNFSQYLYHRFVASIYSQ